jgi:hypothetical protein
MQMGPGAWSNAGTFTNNGTLELSGAAAQTFPGSGTVAAMNNFKINNPNGVALNKNLSIAGKLEVASGSLSLGNFDVRLLSTSTNDASVGQINSSNFVYNGTGRFVVERYINNLGRKWRLLNAPLKEDNAQSIFSQWQNNGISSASEDVEIWGPVGGTPTTSVTGLAYGSGYSMHSFDAASNTWVGMMSTKGYSLFDNLGPKPYALFVTSSFKNGGGNIYGGSASTVLTSRGKLWAGDYNLGNLVSDKYHLVSNPYAAVIDFDQVYANSGTSNIENSYWIWDPKLAGMGSYLTYQNGIFTPIGTSLPIAPDYAPGYIQSGQAFFVKTTTRGAGSVKVEENDKVGSGYTSSAVVAKMLNYREILRVNLYSNAATPVLLDGVAAAFSLPYKKEVLSEEDAIKMDNDIENIALKRDGNRLAIESRPLVDKKDTLYIDLYNLKAGSYQLQIGPGNSAVTTAMSAWLLDLSNGTRTPLSLGSTNTVTLNVSSGTTALSDKYAIVLEPAASLPITFTSIKVAEKGVDNMVEWTSGVESQIDHYEVEYHDGSGKFESIGTVKAKNIENSTYSFIHRSPAGVVQYYRVKAVEISGRSKYSIVAVIRKGSGKGRIQFYPNPVEGNQFSVSIQNLPKDVYTVKLLNLQGLKVMEQKVTHGGGSLTRSIDVPQNIASGVYVLQVSGLKGVLLREQIRIQH